MSSEEDEIILLQRELEYLKISTSNKIASLENRIARLQSVSSSHTSSRPRQGIEKALQSTPAAGHRDRDGTEIYIGSLVTFLTKGVYDSTEGVVVSYNKKHIIAQDYKSRRVERAPRNVRVVTGIRVVDVTDVRRA